LAIGVGILRHVRVVDVDERHGGVEELERLIQINGPLPVTPRQVTGADGEHILFNNWPPQKYLTKIAPGIELLGPGKYFVGAPSVHPKTRRPYKWTHKVNTSFARAPQWLIDLSITPRDHRPSRIAATESSRRHLIASRHDIGESSHRPIANEVNYARAAFRRAAEIVSGTRTGARNNVLNRESFGIARLVSAGMVDQTSAMAALIDAGIAAGLSQTEAASTVASAFRARGL
jgi:hypothetical protein